MFAVAALAAGLAGALGYLWFRPEGEPLGHRAWFASFTERGQPAPAEPHEGWPLTRFSADTEGPVELPGRLHIEHGWIQRFSGGHDHRVLVLGASVAYGAYASTLETTWLALVARDLRADVVAAARPGRRSAHEVAAYDEHAARENPELVVLVDGLNDLTLGETASTESALKRRPLATHSGDFGERVRVYLHNVDALAERCARDGRELVVVLQPAPFAKPWPSRYERRILELGEAWGTIGDFQASYATWRAVLSQWDLEGRLRFVDASAVFRDHQTTFADFYHFGDAGHLQLARAIVQAIASPEEKRRISSGS